MAYFYVVSQHTGRSAWLILNNETHVQFLCVLYMLFRQVQQTRLFLFCRESPVFLHRRKSVMLTIRRK